MTLLQDLNRHAPGSETLIHVYKTKIVFNARAAKLLGLEDGDRVVFRIERDFVPTRTYVGKRKHCSYEVVRRRRCFVVNSTSLAKDVASSLEGTGTYRIEGESMTKDSNGDTYYLIFFKRFE